MKKPTDENTIVNEAVPINPKEEVSPTEIEYIKELKPYHDELLTRIAINGEKIRDVAADTGYTHEWLTKLWRSKVGQARIKELLAKVDVELVKERVKQLANKAVQRLTEVLEENNPDDKALVVRVAQDLLDRAAVNAPKEQKIQLEHIHDAFRTAIEEASAVMEEKKKEKELEANA